MVRDHTALLAYLAGRSTTPFAWGSDANDCVSFAAGAVQAQTGVNPLADLGGWATEDEAREVLEGYGGLAAAVNTVLQPVAPALAQRGDVALVNLPSGAQVLMVVEGDTLVGAGPAGAQRIQRRAMAQAWRAA